MRARVLGRSVLPGFPPRTRYFALASLATPDVNDDADARPAEEPELQRTLGNKVLPACVEHGSVSNREAAVEQKDKDVQAAIKDAKKREKAAKEAEAKAIEAQNAAEEAEQRVQQGEAEIAARRKELAARSDRLDDWEREIDVKEHTVSKERKRVEGVAAEQEAERARLEARHAEQEAREKELVKRGKELDAQLADVNRRMDAADRQAGQNRTKQERLKEKETELTKQAEVNQSTQRELEVEEKRMRLRRKELEQQAADCERRVAACETREAHAKRQKDEALEAINALGSSREALERRKAELDSRDQRLSRVAATNRALEDDVARRETVLANEQKDLRAKERMHDTRSAQLEAQAAQLDDRRREVGEREDAVTAREHAVLERERAVEEQLRQCEESAAATQRRSEALDHKERDLVAWMKEMQWREMILGADEELVQRQPVTPIVRPTKRAVVAAGNNGSGGGGGTGMNQSVIDPSASVFGGGRQSSVNLAASSAVLAVASPSKHHQQPTTDASPGAGEAIANVFPEGFAHRAFGHAVVSVQFRRLKDQYVSAQMRHARAEVSGNEERRRAIAGRKKRMARAGIAVSQPSGDLCEEAQREGVVETLEAHVRQLSIAFSRAMAKLRAFDGYESPTSAEKLAELQDFTSGEQAVLTMAANLEYVLRSVQVFLHSIESSSPLDHKERAKDVQDLVNKTSRWWAQSKEAALATTQQLLEDRQRYLSQALAVLAAHERVSGGMGSSHHGASSPHRRSRRTTGHDDNNANTEEAAWPYGSELLPPQLLGSSVDGGKAAETPYVEPSHAGHVRESAILAPRGLATLRAVSNAQESTSPEKERPRTGGAVALRSNRESSPSALRPTTAPPAVTKPAAPPIVAGALGGPEAHSFRGPEQTTSEESLMQLGAHHHHPPTHNAAAGSSAAAATALRRAPPTKQPFDLNEFLGTSAEAVTPPPRLSSPYSVPPVRRSSVPSVSGKPRGHGGEHGAQQRASSAQPRGKTRTVRPGLPPTSPS